MRRTLGFAVALLLLVGLATAGDAAVVQVKGLRLTVQSQIQPYKLPRKGVAPIAVFLSGHIGSTTGEVPPQLQRMTVKVNRHGLLDDTGLPTCRLTEIQPGSTAHALANCRDALVGSGRFWASVVFPEQRPYPTRGRLLVFNGRKGGQPVLFAHIYTTQPFNSSFVVTFVRRRIHDGPYGTELAASFPQALGEWGFVDRIKLTMRRKFTRHGKQRSFFNAGCPALPEATTAVFPLAKVSFSFEASRQISLTVDKSCGVKR